MRNPPVDRIGRFRTIVSLIPAISALLGSQWLMLRKVEPFYSWFYSFAWWSYLWIADRIAGNLGRTSLIRNRTREFLWLLPWSVTCWLIFEVFNLFLNNWQYVNLPSTRWLRWPGYALAYATVFPALFVTRDLIQAFGWFREWGTSPLRFGTAWRAPCFIIGAVGVSLVVLLPELFFPLVWAAPTCMLEPLVHRYGGDSLVRRWEQEGFRPILLLLCAGAVCGFLWEFWNYWAGAKWVYTIPFVGFLKIFEMPVLGFFGFPFFALECHVMVGALKLLFPLEPGERSTGRRMIRTVPRAAALAAFWMGVFHLIDTYTVVSLVP